jgi:hypothetical protein
MSGIVDAALKRVELWGGGGVAATIFDEELLAL